MSGGLDVSRPRAVLRAPCTSSYVDRQRTADEAKQLINALGMSAHLDEYKARAFVVAPTNGTTYGPADLTAFQNLLRTRRSSNLKIIGVGAGATFVNNVIAKSAFAVAGILTYGGSVDKNITSSTPVPATFMCQMRRWPGCISKRTAPHEGPATRRARRPISILVFTRDWPASGREQAAGCQREPRAGVPERVADGF